MYREQGDGVACCGCQAMEGSDSRLWKDVMVEVRTQDTGEGDGGCGWGNEGVLGMTMGGDGKSRCGG